jgi:hypothetical protein
MIIVLGKNGHRRLQLTPRIRVLLEDLEDLGMSGRAMFT